MGKRARADDGKSLQEYVSLITQHQWDLRRFILSLMPGSPDVDDVLQETNIVLWEKRKRFTPGSNFLAWSTTIARFQVMRFRGMARRFQTMPFSDEFVRDLADVMVAEESERHLMTALEDCLGKLGERQRTLLEIRYTPGRSVKDYAAERGTTAEVLRVTLHRIRQALRRCVENTLERQSA